MFIISTVSVTAVVVITDADHLYKGITFLRTLYQTYLFFTISDLAQ